MKKQIFRRIKQRIQRYRFNRKLKRMDYWYYHSIQQYILPHPPSFYYKYTAEEIKEIERASYERAKKLIEELE
ncbi:MAG: hypothetical protein IJA58_00180 [Lachnospiraceae bacterium]|nr:hypothetical protein [Lachnospiraceae bacterium]